MAELITLARPYAKAAFLHARDNNALDSWSAALSMLAEASMDKKLTQILDSPKLSAADKAATFVELLGDVCTKKIENFISLVATNERLGLLSEINALFQEFKANLTRKVDVEVSSAYPIDDAYSKQLTETLTRTLEREVSLHTKIDKELLGGLLIRAGDTVIDGSVRGRLAKLADAINA